MNYAIRLPANENLLRDIEELLIRPMGRPSDRPVVRYKGFLYQAASWKTARHVVAKVEHHAGELFPRVGLIVTNLTLPSRAAVRFYNKRGTAEQCVTLVVAEGIDRRKPGWLLHLGAIRPTLFARPKSIMEIPDSNHWRRLFSSDGNESRGL